MDNDTAAFAVQTIRPLVAGSRPLRYPLARRLIITADGCGTNNSRGRLWKLELQRLADELGLSIEVHHSRREPASGTRSSTAYSRSSTLNWRAKPLISYRVIIDLIAWTTTKAGLKVLCELDTNKYQGIAVSDAQMQSLKFCAPTCMANGTTQALL